MTLNRVFWPAVGCVVAIVGALEITSARGETQTWDEGIHISAGYAYLTRGDYRWNVEHPPLAKIMSALPLTMMGLDTPVTGEGWKKNDEVRFGIDFLYGNRKPADAILFAARSMTMLLSLLFLAAVAWWTRRRFGPAAALLALVLCAFDPNMIAHGRYVTTDVPVTALYFFACMLWVEYLEDGRARSLAAAVMAFALAMVTKYSAVLLIPTFIALYVVRWAQRPREFPVRRAALAAGAAAAALFVVVNIVYWPETWRCLTTHTARLSDVVDRGNLAGKVLYRVGHWIPLPKHAYLYGLNKVAKHNAEGHTSYLLGLVDQKGWWYYFPVVFAVKSTMAALAAALLLAAVGAWRGVRARIPRRDDAPGWLDRLRAVPIVWIGLLFPPLFYFGFSITSAINIGMRHILPVYPFLYVAAAALLSRLPARKAARYGMVGLGILQIGECASIAPDYLAFFNAPAGGPGNGPHYLVDSNIDWGQDVKKLVKWLDAHGTRTVYICYFGNAQLRYYGVDERTPPRGLDRKAWDDLDGYVVANVTPLNGAYVPLVELAPLRLRDPIAKIGWSMYVYDFRKKRPTAR